MHIRTVDINAIRTQIIDCDHESALTVLHQLQVFMGRFLDSSVPNIYVLQLLPELAAATTSLLGAAGLVTDQCAAKADLQHSRQRLLGCFDSMIDESESFRRSRIDPQTSVPVLRSM